MEGWGERVVARVVKCMYQVYSTGYGLSMLPCGTTYGRPRVFLSRSESQGVCGGGDGVSKVR